MRNLNVLVLCHEQRSHFSAEPGYSEVLLPLTRIEGVSVFPYVYQRITSLQNGGRDRTIVGFLEKDLSSVCEIVRPDLIINLLTWHHQSVPGEVLRRLRQAHCDRLVTVFFDHDETNRHMLADERSFFEASKVNVVADSPLRAERIRNGVGVYADWGNRDSVMFSPVPIDPELFFADPDVRARIGIMGSKEGRRVEVLDHLVRSYANVYRGGSLLDEKEHLPIRDYARELRRNLVNVVTSTQVYRSQIKGRSFQAIASGTCLVEERNRDNESFFDPGGVWFWSGYDELRAAIDAIMTRPESALARARDYRASLAPCFDPRNWLERVLALADR